MFLLAWGYGWAGDEHNGRAVALTLEEKQWLAAHPRIRVASDPNAPPIEWLDKRGVPTGLAIDFLSLVEKKLGICFKTVKLSSWAEILEAAKERRVDLLTAAGPSRNRRDFLLFTSPYLVLPGFILVRDDVHGPLTMDDLKGKKIAVVSQFVWQDYINEAHPEIGLIQAPSISTALKMVSFGQAYAVINDMPTAAYQLQKHTIANLRVVGESGYHSYLSMASRSDWPLLHSIVEKALASISPVEEKAIMDKWVLPRPTAIFCAERVSTRLLIGLGLMLSLIIGVIVWNRSLKKQVSKRTGELSRQLDEQKKYEQALFDSERRFASFFRANPLWAAITTQEGLFLDVNDSFTKVTGYSKEEAVGTTSKKLGLWCNPNDRDRLFRLLQERGFIENQEVNFRKKNGELINGLWSAELADYGEQSHIINVVVDITQSKKADAELRKSRERLDLALQASSDGIWDLDVKSQSVYLSPRCFTMFGYEPNELQANMDTLKKLVHPDDVERVLGTLQAHMAGSAERISGEYRLKNKSGQWQWVFSRGKVVEWDDDGNPSRFMGTHVDITELKQADLELRKKEYIIQSASSAIVTTNLDLQIDLANPAFLSMWGLSGPEEALGLPITDFWVSTNSTSQIINIVNEIGGWTGEAKAKRRDGSLFIVQTSVSMLRDNTGQPIGFMASSIDISERKQAEQGLRDYVQHLENLEMVNRTMRQPGDPLVVLRNTLEVMVSVFQSDRCWLLHPCDPEADHYRVVVEHARPEWPGASATDEKIPLDSRVREAFKQILSSDRPFVMDSATVQSENEIDTGFSVKSNMAMAIRPRVGDPWVLGLHQCEYKRVWTENEKRLFADIGSRMNDALSNWLLTKDLKESESRFRTLFETMVQGVAFCDDKGIIKMANPAVAEMIGVTEEQMVGASIHDDLFQFVSVDGAPLSSDQSGSALALATGKPVPKTVAGVINQRDGKIRWFSGTAYPLFKPGENRPYIVYSTMEDITERQQAAEEKAKLEAQLRHSQKIEAVGTLASGVAHDFNNILQAIGGYVQLMTAKSGRDKDDAENLLKIKDATSRASELVRQLLTFGRKMEPKLITVDVNDQVRQAADILARTIPKMVEVKTELADGLWPVLADPNQMEQMLINLGSNASDAMPMGGRLVMRTENFTADEGYCKSNPMLKPGDYVLLSVSDNGLGMDQNTLEHMFEPFFTTKEVGDGTGLGLSSVYGIVQGHNGNLTCYSRPNQGTVFHIYLPAQLGASIEPKKPGLGVENFYPGTETILLVDDEPSIIEVAQQILEASGYTVITASSGEAALAIFSRHTDIALVILDLGMPGMGGMACLQEMLSWDPKAKVLIASGYAAPNQTEELMKAGAAGFIAKPYRFNDMLKMMRQVIESG